MCQLAKGQLNVFAQKQWIPSYLLDMQNFTNRAKAPRNGLYITQKTQLIPVPQLKAMVMSDFCFN